MSKDNRIFRVVKQGYRSEKISYKTRTAISGMFARRSYGNSKRPDILRVEAIDPSDIPWTDVTDEFRNKPDPKCGWHTTYTGVRKPAIWGWKDSHSYGYALGCKCADIYAEKNPEYPKHDPLCALRHTDPAACSCRIITKLCE